VGAFRIPNSEFRILIEDDLGADKGLDPRLLRCFPETRRSGDRVAIDQRHCGQPELGRSLDQVLW
jgi:hypothetical protein